MTHKWLWKENEICAWVIENLPKLESFWGPEIIFRSPWETTELQSINGELLNAELVDFTFKGIRTGRIALLSIILQQKPVDQDKSNPLCLLRKQKERRARVSRVSQKLRYKKKTILLIQNLLEIHARLMENQFKKRVKGENREH